MAERFERLYELPRNLYTEGSPVIISAGVLLKDTQSGNVVAQIKFQSVAEKAIRALKLSLAAYDVSGKPLQSVPDYQYLELNISIGEDFGSNKAIVMPVAVTRSFKVETVTVIFKDGTLWETAEPFEALPQSQHLNLGNAEIEKQYRIATNTNAKYAPCTDKDLWQCACGSWNRVSSCPHCRITKDKVFGAFDISVLTEQTNSRLAAEAEEKRIAAEKEAKRRENQAAAKKAALKKAKVIAVFAIPIVIFVLIFTLWLYPDVIQPNSEYKAAQALLANGKYDGAATAFNELGEYKDSAEKTLEAKYQQACLLIEQNKLKEAMEIFTVLGEYEDCPLRVKEIKYILAQELLVDSQYETAKEMFSEITDYSDSEKMMVECDYLLAQDYLSKGQYVETISLLEPIADYKEAADLLMEAKYSYAMEKMELAKYGEAISLFEETKSYRDTNALINECHYLSAKLLINAGDYAAAKSILSNISTYKDSEKYIDLINDVKSFVYIGETTSYSWEYMWVITKIDTTTCSSYIVRYTGRADGRDDTIDYAYGSSEYLGREWKREAGKIYISQSGEDPYITRAGFSVWTISSDWSTIKTMSYSMSLDKNDNTLHPGTNKTWKRLDKWKENEIKKSFIRYFQIDEYNTWDSEEDWLIALEAINN